MGEFVCRVADATGRVYSHIEAAGTQAEARQKLADRGLYVYSVENRNRLLSGVLQAKSNRQVGGSDFLILNQQFNTLIKAGLPILRALDLLAERASSPRLRRSSGRLRIVCAKGSRSPRRLRKLACCFPRYIRRPFSPVRKSVQSSGVLDYYIAYQKVSAGVRKKILGTCWSTRSC
jgi:type II secretory pathway component PulF